MTRRSLGKVSEGPCAAPSGYGGVPAGIGAAEAWGSPGGGPGPSVAATAACPWALGEQHPWGSFFFPFFLLFNFFPSLGKGLGRCEAARITRNRSGFVAGVPRRKGVLTQFRHTVVVGLGCFFFFFLLLLFLNKFVL